MPVFWKWLVNVCLLHRACWIREWVFLLTVTCVPTLPFKTYRAVLKTSRGLFQSIQLYQSNKMITLELSAYVSEIPNAAHTTPSQNLWYWYKTMRRHYWTLSHPIGMFVISQHRSKTFQQLSLGFEFRYEKVDSKYSGGYAGFAELNLFWVNNRHLLLDMLVALPHLEGQNISVSSDQVSLLLITVFVE